MLTTAVIGCKLADRASQSKGLYKTEKGFAFTEQGDKKLFNVTRWEDSDAQKIPIAVSLEVKEKHVLATGAETDDSVNSALGNIEIIMHIKDLRPDHLSNSTRKVTLFYEETSGNFHGEGKDGSYQFQPRVYSSIGSIEFKSGKNNYSAYVSSHKMIEVYHKEMKEEEKKDNLGFMYSDDLGDNQDSISERMFNIMRGEVQSPAVEGGIFSSGIFSSNCADMLAEHKDGEVIFYSPRKRLTDKGFAFRIYGLNSLFSKGFLKDKLKCQLIDEYFRANSGRFKITEYHRRENVPALTYFSDQVEKYGSNRYITGIIIWNYLSGRGGLYTQIRRVYYLLQ